MSKSVKENQPATIDGASLHVLPTPPVIHLKTADNVRLEMGRVYRAMRSRELDLADGTKLTYVLAQLGKLIELAEFEQRIELLERARNEYD